MTDDIRDFFLNLKNPNFLAMKLLLGVFNKMSEVDDVSRRIVDNISVLSQYNIRLVDSKSMYNYVYSEDDLSEIKFAISKSAQEHVVCHEFGHLLLDLFMNGEVPEEYMEVNMMAVERLMERKDDVSEMLRRFRDELYHDLASNVNEAIEFIQRHPDICSQYLKNNPEETENDFIGEVIVDYYVFMTNLDRKSSNYNRIGNIIDSMFHGSNPFARMYGNQEFYPLLAAHDEKYFIEDEYSPEFAGFEEQFADYLVLRVYGDEMPGVVNTVRNLVGDEWFLMMDKVYEGIAGKVLERGKVYQYK